MKPINLNMSKAETARLAEENKMMEIRLQELKLAMDKEKQARSSEGLHWQSAGATRPSASHLPDMLRSNIRIVEKPKVQRTRKVKVLTDEPIVLPPQRTTVVEDIKKIMKKDLPSTECKDSSPKQKRCGQCEMKGAAVLCQDCVENYCPSCFASFHLKGALRKHRSVPIQALGLRQSPRISFLPKPPPMANRGSEKAKEKTRATKISKEILQSPSLLDGQYDEQANAADFQAALLAWRSGESCGSDKFVPTNIINGLATNQASKKSASKVEFVPSVPFMSGQSYSIDVKSTSTDSIAKPLKIEFHSDISYVDKLLLRKHRRDYVDAMPGSRPLTAKSGEQGPEDASAEEDGTVNRSVEFQALYAVTRPQPEPSKNGDRSPPRVASDQSTTVVEVTSLMDCSNMEQVTSYQVEEEPGCIEFVSEKNDRNDAENIVKSVAKPNRRKSVNVPTDPRKSSAKVKTRQQRPPSEERESTTLSSTDKRSQSKNNECTVVSKMPLITSQKSVKSPVKSPKTSTEMAEIRKTFDVLPASKSATQRPPSPTLVPSRPKSTSGKTSTPRPKHSQSVRHSYRQILGDGVLTKKASAGLSSVASRPVSDWVACRGLGPILTLGVAPAQSVDMVVSPAVARTPRTARGKENKLTISYKLYAMGPKSWRPDNSVGEAVPAGGVVLADDTELAQADDMAEDIACEITALNNVNVTGRSFSLASKEAVAVHTTKERNVNQSSHQSSLSRDRMDQSLILNELGQTSGAGFALPSRTDFDPTHSAHDTDLFREQSRDSQSESVDSGRISRLIIVDGDDMTSYDLQMSLDPSIYDTPGGENGEDNTALEELEWELASMTGRVTSDGKISRLNLHSSQDSAVSSPGGSSENLNSEREIDWETRNDGLCFDELESQVVDELEVRALK